LIIDEDDYLVHFGILRKSGRYPYGSGLHNEGELYPWAEGQTQSQRNKTFLSTVDSLRKQGLTDPEIARGFGITTTQLRNSKSIAKNEEIQQDVNMAVKLRAKGLSNVAIGKRMGKPESTIRNLLKADTQDKLNILNSTSETLRKAVAEKKYIDVGAGVEYHLGVSNDKLKKAVQKLTDEGYQIHYINVDQLGTNHQTKLKVLVAPDTTWKETFANRDQITQATGYSNDGGRTFSVIQPPIQVALKRVGVRYAEQGGTNADGVIYVRPGVSDLTLGSAHYAQVRIAVNGTHYLKGMAMYKDDLPDGVDLLFNTNKKDTGNKLDAMKPIKADPTNPFGSVVRQLTKTDMFGNDIPNAPVRSAMNIVNEEGDWNEWSRSLSSQFLSKQSPMLIKSQLSAQQEKKNSEFTDIKTVANPAVKRKLLSSLADDVDSSAIHLKAAALPRQRSQVILPIESMKPNEIYAPNYRTGDRVILVRHPHGGKFEIPELIVNNNHPEAKKLLGQAKDAVGIHPSMAEKMSGADFDGDTVLVIPNNQGKVKSEPSLERLKGFDPKSSYPAYEGMRRMTTRDTGVEMGRISNLITDMSIRGANKDELARAVRHSMVVIDAEKHELDYKSSERDHGIADLRKRYQGKAAGGASTLLTKAKSDVKINQRKQGFKIDPETGKKIYTETGESYVQKGDKLDKNGKVIRKDGEVVVKSEYAPRLSIVDNAHDLSSGTLVESLYADHSNTMKSLADSVRKELEQTKSIPYSPSAAKAYAPEVARLKADLTLALRNSPLERQAQILANAQVALKKQANPDMEAAELKKVKYLALEEARQRTNSKKPLIEIDEDQWAAIQAGAISNSMLEKVLDNTDLDKLKSRALPKKSDAMSSTMTARARQMISDGYTQAAVADQLGVSVSTLDRNLKPKAGDDNGND
jgi:hypothetical protein